MQSRAERLIRSAARKGWYCFSFELHAAASEGDLHYLDIGGIDRTGRWDFLPGTYRTSIDENPPKRHGAD